jgi:4-hydroxythreonine-4-phosphate dehydrogenase
MRIAVSVGDLNGIGLECFAKALSGVHCDDMQFILFAPKSLVIEYLSAIGFAYEVGDGELLVEGHRIQIVDISTDARLEFGKLDAEIGRVAARSIESAVSYVKAGSADILLTLPINKKAIFLSGFEFPGHTEMLGQAFEADPLMILFTKNVRVALVTMHIPIKRVSDKLSPSVIERKYASLESSLRKDFGIERPKIAVLGLNPHAGEQGNLGKEEVYYINKLIPKLNEKYGLSKAEGSFPADGFFGFGQYKNYDGILAMYHDQGLIPLKLLAEGGGVNFTANLPVVRVSPDHGTAFELAGKNQAEGRSTLEAICAGIEIFANRNKFNL